MMKSDNSFAPVSHHFVFETCANCPNIHVLFLTEKDYPLCQATISKEQLWKMIEMLET